MQKVTIAMGIVIALLIVIGLSLPQHSRVAASLEIDARPATVFALLNDFSRVALWSPWLERDPRASVEITGPRRGVGARMTWDGPALGSGSQLITASEPFKQVATVINPGEKSEVLSHFELRDTGSTTIVRWSFEADNGYNLVGRYAALLLNGIIRRDYEHGLHNLAELAESLPRADFGDLEVELLEVAAQDIAYRRAAAQRDPVSMAAALGEAYFRVLGFIDAQDLQGAGAPLSIIRSFDGNKLQFDAAIPVRGVIDSTPREAAGVNLGRTYAGSVVRVTHQGSYRSLGETQSKIVAYLAAHGIERNGDMWESYVNDPAVVPESELLTEIYYPVR
jgi:effector-binding domain-containing protein